MSSISASFPLRQSADSPSSISVEISDWVEINKGSLIGAFTATAQPSGIMICGCMLHRNASTEWVMIPGIPQMERDGMIRRLSDGKIAYKTLVKFRSPEQNKRWQSLILDELRKRGHI